MTVMISDSYSTLCSEKKTPTHIFSRSSMNDVWI